MNYRLEICIVMKVDHYTAINFNEYLCNLFLSVNKICDSK